MRCMRATCDMFYPHPTHIRATFRIWFFFWLENWINGSLFLTLSFGVSVSSFCANTGAHSRMNWQKSSSGFQLSSDEDIGNCIRTLCSTCMFLFPHVKFAFHFIRVAPIFYHLREIIQFVYYFDSIKFYEYVFVIRVVYFIDIIKPELHL